MTKLPWTKAPTSLLECAVCISARKKLIHTMSLDTDRPNNRATVVGCAISATRNYLKLYMSRTLNPLLSNIHAETLKLWKRSARRAAVSRTDAVHQSTNRPLMNSVCPPRCPLHSPRFLGMQTCTTPRAGVALTIESGADMQPSFAVLQGATPPATSCLGAFWTPAP
jgi:hypothetical protein